MKAPKMYANGTTASGVSDDPEKKKFKSRKEFDKWASESGYLPVPEALDPSRGSGSKRMRYYDPKMYSYGDSGWTAIGEGASIDPYLKAPLASHMFEFEEEATPFVPKKSGPVVEDSGRKPVFTGNEYFDTFKYADKSGQYSTEESVTKDIDKKTGKFIDVSKSFDKDGKYMPVFIPGQKEGGIVGKIKGYSNGTGAEGTRGASNNREEDFSEGLAKTASDAGKGILGSAGSGNSMGAMIKGGDFLASTAADIIDSRAYNQETGTYGSRGTAFGVGALKGVGKGASLGSEIGSAFGPKGQAIGAIAGAATGIVAGGTSSLVKHNRASDAVETARQEAEAERNIAIQNQKYNDSMRKEQMQRYEGFKDGGTIKGPGTEKSDSILAKVKPGSFVVPAENADKAEVIRKTMFSSGGKVTKAPSLKKKANLNQEDGELVRLSNNEHLFTPKEKNKIINHLGEEVLEALAPNAETDEENVGFAEGGDTETETELERIKRLQAEAEKKSAASEKKASDVEKVREERGRAYEKTMMLQEQRLKFKKDFEERKKKLEREYKSKMDAYETYKKQQDELKNRKGDYLSKQNKLYNETERLANEKKMLEEASKMKKELDLVSKKYSYVSNDKNFNPDGTVKNEASKKEAQSLFTTTGEKAEKAAGEDDFFKRLAESSASAKGNFVTRAPKVGGAKKATAPSNNLTPEQMKAMGPEIAKTMGAKEQTPLDLSKNMATAKETPVETTPMAQKEAGSGSGFKLPKGAVEAGINAVGGLANYVIPFQQTQMGRSFLTKAGKRPVDQIDPEYLATIDQAKSQAKFGFTPEEDAALRQQNVSALRSGEAASRLYSGGSASNALALQRDAANQYFGRGLQQAVQNKNLQLSKQAMANEMVANKAEMSRRLFNDTMTAWQQNQAAGAELIGAGLQNMMSAKRLNDEMAFMRKYQQGNNWMQGFGNNQSV